MKTENQQKGKIETIETLRGIASLAVCLFHLTKTNLPLEGSAAILSKIFAFGWLGVEVFFVVSGFIIPYSMIKGKYTLSHFFRFLAKRCIRIEPPYLVSILMIIVLGYISMYMPGYKEGSFNLSIGQVASHVAYLPTHLGFEWLSPVYWSLEAEFHYYILIALILPIMFKGKIRMMGIFAILLAASYIIPLYVFSYMPFFIAGIAACALRFEKLTKLEFGIVVLICMAVSIHRDQPAAMYLSIGATAGAIAWLNIKSKVTDFLGKISFSLYLVHVPIGSKCLNFLGRYANSEFRQWLIFIFGLVVCIVAAWLFYLLVEKPCQKYSHKLRYSS